MGFVFATDENLLSVLANEQMRELPFFDSNDLLPTDE